MHRYQDLAHVNGTRLYYEMAGSGDPLVLIHGHTLDTRMWGDQFEPFARHYRVIRYDMRVYGKSALPTADSYAPADDLMALLRHLGLRSAHILGQSRGGAVAIDFALTYPEATATLIAVDAVLRRFQWKGFGKSLSEIHSAAGRLALKRHDNVGWMTRCLLHRWKTCVWPLVSSRWLETTQVGHGSMTSLSVL